MVEKAGWWCHQPAAGVCRTPPRPELLLLRLCSSHYDRSWSSSVFLKEKQFVMAFIVSRFIILVHLILCFIAFVTLSLLLYIDSFGTLFPVFWAPFALLLPLSCEHSHTAGSPLCAPFASMLYCAGGYLILHSSWGLFSGIYNSQQHLENRLACALHSVNKTITFSIKWKY